MSDQAGRFAAQIQRLLGTDADRRARVWEFQEVVDNWETPGDAREGPAETVIRDLAYDLHYHHEDEEYFLLLREALAALRALGITPTMPRHDALMADGTVRLYRPVGPEELALLRAAGFLRWPPRLPHQPIFYPVTNEDYAAEIASKWNVKDSGGGFVTRFHVRAEFMARFTVQRVGASHHTEWWIPADMLDELNDNIVGTIEVIRSFGG